jgi:hypothetical protein
MTDVDCMACIANLARGGGGIEVESGVVVEGITHAVINFGTPGRGWIACTVEWDPDMGYYTMYASREPS